MTTDIASKHICAAGWYTRLEQGPADGLEGCKLEGATTTLQFNQPFWRTNVLALFKPQASTSIMPFTRRRHTETQ